ncbi:long-chain fatty acid--CoA ligase [Umezawaea endophytica]|uniref:Long-chain fatty acid--CoA ligase n=1 Tax=Umezawaea endophytica TaxID=1654476 RepID=A0A9X2VVW6_9PSEU|nr:long-chain fatty acid--CoA ligase [Umezawaea endophytica]MCS7483157.1 long-chain fatty acid--CoA ligase [Umezawaea endophytica]
MYLTQGLHRAVQQQPDEVMTICGDRRRTFAEVADRVSRFAGALRELGVGESDRVAILAQNSDRYIEYLLAVPWAGAVLNPANTRWSPTEIAYSLIDSDSRVLLVDDAFAETLPVLRELSPCLTTVIHIGDGPAPVDALSYEDLIAAAQPVPDVRRGGAELAGLFYTGGTTGVPKGVMLSHDNLGTSWLGGRASGSLVAQGGRTLHVAPLFHIACLTSWGATLMAGGSHVILPSFDPVTTMTAVQAQQVTDVLLVPTMIQLLVDHPRVAEYDLTSLRSLLYGASPIHKAVLERAMAALPGARFVQAYGMTELAPIATLLTPADHERGLLHSAGRAAPHAEVRIVDPGGVEVQRGTVGEIAVRGGHVMLGYWGKAEETSQALRDGWMHTGDGGYLDGEGYLYIVDRIKDMIVSGGENVYSVEVENALSQHPAVAQCAVIGVPDAKWGERVHAVVVLRSGASVTADELREQAKKFIAGYKAPRSVEFVDTLPISGAGKVLKRVLRATHWGSVDRQVS